MKSEAILRTTAIQRFSVDDGPGIRTTVFCKGCNLHCVWCHNPETISKGASLQFNAGMCIHCGMCVSACPSDAHAFEQEVHTIDRVRCKVCGACAQTCFSGALKILGEERTVSEILGLVLRDKDFFDNTGGGVTFSGGEPMLQHEALRQALELCKDYGLHTAVDTAGNVPFSWFEEIMPFTDLFLYDLKCFSSSAHKRWTGVANELILQNIQKLGERGAKVFIRTPLIEGVNTDESEIESLARFASALEGVQLYQLLPYHDYGAGKYETLGQETKSLKSPDEVKLQKITDVFLRYDIPVRLR